MKEDINKCLEALHQGGIIIYPTDTVWGLGCDATNPDAVEKIYKIKQRDKSKSMLILLENINQVFSYVEKPPEVALDMIELSTEPLTVVFEKAKNLPLNLIASDGSIAIRVSKNKFTSELIRRFKKPVVSTSANFSGQDTPLSFKEIDDDLIGMADYVVRFGQKETRRKKASSIIRISNQGEIDIIRK
ncbi:MAG: L-threonylcarbamoyladenylate synthase [Bacteroidales bacterium]